MYGEFNLFHSFYWNILILCIHNVDTLDICMKKFDAIKILFDKMTAFWTEPFFTLLCACTMYKESYCSHPGRPRPHSRHTATKFYMQVFQKLISRQPLIRKHNWTIGTLEGRCNNVTVYLVPPPPPVSCPTLIYFVPGGTLPWGKVSPLKFIS